MYFIYSIDCILMVEKLIMILRTDLFTRTSNWKLNVPLMRKDED